MNNVISFSGIDGSGKTTQIMNLIEYYRRQNKKCILYTELPKTEPLDENISLTDYYNLVKDYDVAVLRSCYRTAEHVDFLQYVKNKPHSIEDTYKLQRFFVRDTYYWFKEVILPLIVNKKTVIFDRFVYDELPYQMLFNSNVDMIEELISILPKPHSFYLKIDVETMKQRNANREDGKNKLFSTDERISNLINNYNAVFKNFNCTAIEGKLDSTEVSDYIIQNLDMNNRELVVHGEEYDRM